MHFSWIGFWLAPLLVPLIGSALSAPLMGGDGPVVLPFLLLLIPSCVISYGAMIFLFLPALFVLSRLRPMTGWTVSALGFVLGLAVIVPVTALAWKSGGPDSGPPVESFLTFFARWIDPSMLFFPVAGLVTAALYWWFGTRRDRPAALASPE